MCARARVGVRVCCIGWRPPSQPSTLSFPPPQVTNGKGAMPAWGGQLSPDEIAAVAAYVYDQAAGDKW